MNKTRLAVHVFNKYARVYQDKYMDVSLYHATLDLFAGAVAKEDAELLELACGPGNVTRYLLDKRPHWKILGTDLAENMLELARINNPEAEFRNMDCRDITTLGRSFDGVVCGFCLPYLSKEEAIRLIGDAAAVLRPGGALYLSTMEDAYDHSKWQQTADGDRVFMHYHEEAYLSAAIGDSGLQIADLQRIRYPGSDGSITTDLVITATKKY